METSARPPSVAASNPTAPLPFLLNSNGEMNANVPTAIQAAAQEVLLGGSNLIQEISIDEQVWNEGIRDTGVPPSHPVKSKIYRAENGWKFKGIWNLANEVWVKMDKNRDRFQRLPKATSKTEIVMKIGKMIFNERQLNAEGQYNYPQETFHLKITSAWGKESEHDGVTQDDIARAYGILCDPDFEAERCVILKRQGTSRDVVDDPANKVLNVSQRLMLVWQDINYKVSHPPNWEDAANLPDFGRLDPNNTDRVGKKHTAKDGMFFQKCLIEPTKRAYRIACRRWRSDTGGGAGQPENFMDWDPRRDHLFHNFTGGQQPALLTWIFMKDRTLGYILEEEHEELPSALQVSEGRTDQDTTNPSHDKKRSRRNSFESEIMAEMKSSRKIIEASLAKHMAPDIASPAMSSMTGTPIGVTNFRNNAGQAGSAGASGQHERSLLSVILNVTNATNEDLDWALKQVEDDLSEKQQRMEKMVGSMDNSIARMKEAQEARDKEKWMTFKKIKKQQEKELNRLIEKQNSLSSDLAKLNAVIQKKKAAAGAMTKADKQGDDIDDLSDGDDYSSDLSSTGFNDSN